MLVNCCGFFAFDLYQFFIFLEISRTSGIFVELVIKVSTTIHHEKTVTNSATVIYIPNRQCETTRVKLFHFKLQQIRTFPASLYFSLKFVIPAHSISLTFLPLNLLSTVIFLAFIENIYECLRVLRQSQTNLLYDSELITILMHIMFGICSTEELNIFLFPIVKWNFRHNQFLRVLYFYIIKWTHVQ
jgi:hypothetical protein